MNNIEKKIILNAKVSRVWKALTNPAELQTWMLVPTTFEPEQGKKFTFKGEPDENWDGIISCQVKEIIENKKLSFTWNSQLINAETLVSISLKDLGDKTELTLIHSGWEKVPANAEVVRKHHEDGWEIRIYEKIKELVENKVKS